MPSPDTDVIKACVARVEITTAALVADCRKERQRVNAPAVFVDRQSLILIQVDELPRVMIEQEFAVESEVRGGDGESSNGLAPDFLVARNVKRGAMREVEVVGFVSVVANPSHPARFVIEEFGEGVYERIFPPAVFHELSEGIFVVDGTVKDFAVKPVSVAENRHVVLPQG